MLLMLSKFEQFSWQLLLEDNALVSLQIMKVSALPTPPPPMTAAAAASAEMVLLLLSPQPLMFAVERLVFCPCESSAGVGITRGTTVAEFSLDLSSLMKLTVQLDRDRESPGMRAAGIAPAVGSTPPEGKRAVTTPMLLLTGAAPSATTVDDAGLAVPSLGKP